MYKDIKTLNIFRDMSGTYRTTNTGINIYTLKNNECTAEKNYGINNDDFDWYDLECEDDIMNDYIVDDYDFQIDVVKDCFNAIMKYNKKGYLFSKEQVNVFKEYSVKKNINPDIFKFDIVDDVIYVSK